MTYPYGNVTLFESLNEEQKKTHSGNFLSAQKIISRLQKYQISDEIISRTPMEVISDIILDEQHDALREVHLHETDQ